MNPGKLDVDTVRRHLLALDDVLAQLARHAGKPASVLTEVDLYIGGERPASPS